MNDKLPMVRIQRRTTTRVVVHLFLEIDNDVHELPLIDMTDGDEIVLRVDGECVTLDVQSRASPS